MHTHVFFLILDISNDKSLVPLSDRMEFNRKIISTAVLHGGCQNIDRMKTIKSCQKKFECFKADAYSFFKKSSDKNIFMHRM